MALTHTLPLSSKIKERHLRNAGILYHEGVVIHIESGELPARLTCNEGHSSWKVYSRETNKNIFFLKCLVCGEDHKFYVTRVD